MGLVDASIVGGGARMSRMNSRAALEAAKVGSLAALWSRIDAGTFPRPVAEQLGGPLWDSNEVYRAIAIKPAPEPKQREQPPQPSSRTRERKDPTRTETRKSE